MIDISINIKPLSYYQYLTQNRFRKYITKRGKEYRSIIEEELIKVMIDKDIIESDCKVDISFYFDNKRKNDIDNYAKVILDCMSDIIYTDDRQIIELNVKKFYDKENPRILIKCSSV